MSIGCIIFISIIYIMVFLELRWEGQYENPVDITESIYMSMWHWYWCKFSYVLVGTHHFPFSQIRVTSVFVTISTNTGSEPLNKWSRITFTNWRMAVALKDATMSSVHQVEENRHQKTMLLLWLCSYLWRRLVFVDRCNKAITKVQYTTALDYVAQLLEQKY